MLKTTQSRTVDSWLPLRSSSLPWQPHPPLAAPPCVASASLEQLPPLTLSLHSSVAQIRESLSLLEVEMVELREHTQDYPTKDQLNQIQTQLHLPIKDLK